VLLAQAPASIVNDGEGERAAALMSAANCVAAVARELPRLRHARALRGAACAQPLPRAATQSLLREARF